jgi:hypothetical protein
MIARIRIGVPAHESGETTGCEGLPMRAVTPS